jgi:hypothetical protein
MLDSDVVVDVVLVLVWLLFQNEASSVQQRLLSVKKRL